MTDRSVTATVTTSAAMDIDQSDNEIPGNYEGITNTVFFSLMNIHNFKTLLICILNWDCLGG